MTSKEFWQRLALLILWAMLCFAMAAYVGGLI